MHNEFTLPDKKTILISGGTGLLGLSWGQQLKKDWSVILGTRSRIATPPGVDSVSLKDFERPNLECIFAETQPDVVVHCAGLTSVEACEEQPEMAKIVNTDFAQSMAEVCASFDVPLIHISTDHLFDGKGGNYTEEADVMPQNVYGRTKADAEIAVMKAHAKSLIIRTNFYCWGPSYRASFSDWILKALRNNQLVALFEDVSYTPILADELIETAHELLNSGHKGIFNVSIDHSVSKLQFGKIVAQEFNLDQSLLSATRLSDKKGLVQRPLAMSLSNEKAKAALRRSLGTVRDQVIKLRKSENAPQTLELVEL